MFLTKRRILVTGGAGFIGSHLVDELLEKENMVLCLDDLNAYYNPRIKRANFSNHLSNSLFALKEMDIRDRKALFQAFSEFNPEITVHLAARVGVRHSIKNPFLYESVNVRGTLNVLEASVKCQAQKFVFASSSSVYGINSKVPFAEDDPILKPISPYAATKLAGEAFCHTAAHLYNLPVVVLRFFTVYGPRQRPDLAIYKFTQKLFDAEPLQIFGDGGSSRDYTYVDDIVNGICAAICYQPKPFDIFNLGNSSTVELRKLIKVLEDATAKKAKIKWENWQPGDVPKTWADITKAKNLLLYCPSTILSEGIEKFILWYETNVLSLKKRGH